MPSVLDSQSLGARFDARTEVYLSVLFLPERIRDLGGVLARRRSAAGRLTEAFILSGLSPGIVTAPSLKTLIQRRQQSRLSRFLNVG